MVSIEVELPAMDNRCWFLLSKKLGGNASDAELDEMDDLLHVHPEWRQTVQQVSEIWRQQPEPEPEEDAWLQHIARMDSLGHDTSTFDIRSIKGQPERKNTRRLWLVAASVLGFCLVVACWMILGNSSGRNLPANAAPYKSIATSSGDRKKIVLPEGSRVWLNAESIIEFDQGFGKSHRVVRLSGEAYFDVEKNEKIPFIIQTSAIQVKVTGTVFNVKAYPNDEVSETSLLAGRVEVTVNNRPEDRYILNPNQKLVVREEKKDRSDIEPTRGDNVRKFTNEPLIQLGYINFSGSDSSAIETSWIYNRLIFDNESFEEITVRLERWYGVKIYIEDSTIAEQRVTYTIKNETIAEALRNMQYAVRFNYRINRDVITITK